MPGDAAQPPAADRGAKARFAAMTVLFGTTWFGPVTQTVENLWLGHAWSWTAAFVRGALYGAGMTGAFTLVLVGQPEFGARLAVRRSIAAGRLPPAAHAAAWGPPLRREHRRLRVDRWAVPLYFVTEAALVAAVAATTHGSSWTLWLFAAAAALVAAIAPARVRTRLRTVERFQAQLAEPSPR